MSRTFTKVLESSPEDLLLPNKTLEQSALKEIKGSLDPIAKKYSIFDAVHVDGLDAEQVWAQAQMIVDGTIDKLFTKLSDLAPPMEEEDDEQEDEEASSDSFSGEEQSEDELAQAAADSDETQGSGNERDDFDENDLVDDFDRNELDEEEDGAEENEILGLNQGQFDLQDFQQQVLAMENEDFGEDGDEIDYSKSVEDVGDDEDDDEEMRYEDFFAPPKKKQKVTKRERQAFIEDQEVEDAFENTRKDLFDDDDDDHFSEEDGPRENLSKFERQQLELQKQIEQLEEENVGEKFWAVKGEVQASQRPQDSLVNTEIEFERNAKPAPVITQEVTDNLEEMIRERIKKQEFDDLARRTQLVAKRPKRELAELSEQKSEKSLAEQYEEDQLRSENPDYFQSKDNAVLTAAHKEIVDLYSSLSRKLDALSSWNYTPKAAKPSLSIVADVGAISMEEAQPTANSTSSMLAPQEVYQPKTGDKSETVGRNNLPVSRDEMSTEDKLKARRKSKARSKASNNNNGTVTNGSESQAKSSKKESKDQMFDTLKKGNVTYLDKRGQKRDMRGNVVTGDKKSISSHMKL